MKTFDKMHKFGEVFKTGLEIFLAGRKQKVIVNGRASTWELPPVEFH